MLVQSIIHYSLHFAFPALLAFVFFRRNWIKVYLIFLATMLVDIDHVFSSPVFEASRCSIGFHLLHSYWAIGVYVLLLFFQRPYRIIGIGLLFHMLTDLIDCLFSFYHCRSCVAESPVLELLKAISDFLGW